MENDLVRIALLFDEANGRREVVLAESGIEADTFIVHSIPAFTYGLGWKDCIRLLDKDRGAYEITERGGQLVVRLYVDGSLDRPVIQHLTDELVGLGGSFEVAKNAAQASGMSLLLIALSAKHGFANVERLMGPCEAAGYQWEYGNVYDVEGNPLNWW